MDQFREFQGKNLDECIKQACAYFDSPREKLEIELIQDAKSGIFGIVLARKAKIRARRVRFKENVLDFLADSPAGAQEKPAEPERPEKKAAPRKLNARQEKSVSPGQEKPRHEVKNHKKPVEKPQVAPAELADLKTGMLDGAVEPDSVDYPATPFEQLDSARLEEVALDAAKRLIEPIAGREVTVHVDLSRGRVRLKVDWEGDAGLLIGREGITLAALQYLLSRILSRAMNAAVRVQLEIGDYKSRQDEKLKEIAKTLAEKARTTGRSWSTRPLSSYHRRIIHMALQEEAGVMTRSSGDGPMKRVIIAPKRENA